MTNPVPASSASWTQNQLVERIVHSSKAAGAIVAAAVPLQFDEPLLDALLPGETDVHGVLDELMTLPFVGRRNTEWSYYAPARRVILEMARHEDVTRLRELNETAARYFEKALEGLEASEARDKIERSLMYHLLGAGGEDEARGYDLLLRLTGEAEAAYQPGVMFQLLHMAREQEPLLQDDHRLGLLWLDGRLLLMQNDARAAVKRLTELLSLPLSSMMQAQVELTLSRALQRTGQWADAVIHANSAHNGFAGLDPFEEARALIGQSQAYSGLALSVRGSRAARARLPNRWLDFFNRLGTLIERLPILVYLIYFLGPRRTLPALTRIADDQDWVVARFFVTAAVALRQAEALLRNVAKQEPGRAGVISELQVDVQIASADLYRRLGHPAHSVALLGEVLHAELGQENEHRQAEIRRRMSEALLDLGQTALAIEALRLCIPVYQNVQDAANEAHSRLLYGNGLLQMDREVQEPHDQDRRSVVEAVTQLSRSLDLYAALGDRAGQAEVGRILDGVATDTKQGAETTRTLAGLAASRFRERRFPIRYAHPSVRRFRTIAVTVLALALLVILFFSLRTGTQTEIGATALVNASPVVSNPADFVPTLSVQLPEQQLRAHFRVQFAVLSVVVMLLVYLLGYVFIGLGLISLSSPEALRKAESGVIVMDDDGIWCEALSPNPTPAFGEEDVQRPCATTAVLPWEQIREAYVTDRRVVNRPLAAYSRIDLLGAGEWLTVPGQAVGYEGELGERIADRLPVKPQALGYSIFKGWTGPLIVLTLLLNAALLIAGVQGFSAVTTNLIGPYSLTDLYLYTYVLLLAALAWLLVANPLRAALVLTPHVRWPVWLGLGGLAFQLFFMVAPRVTALRLVSARMPLPRIYPGLIGAFLVVAAGLFVLLARHGGRRPSERRTPVFALPVRLLALAVMLLSLAAAAVDVSREVRAYHAVVEGNEERDWAAGRPSDEATKEALQTAEVKYRFAMQLAPNASAVSAQLAAVLSGLGRHEEALRQYEDALTYRTDRPALFANRAAAYQQSVQGKPTTTITSTVALTEAVNDYRRALDAEPTNTEWQLRLALVFHQLGRFGDALAVYQAILDREPGNADALAGRGWSLVQMAAQDQRAAESTRKQVTALTDQRAKMDAAQSPQEAADSERRIAELMTAADRSSSSSSAFYLAAAKDFARALELLAPAGAGETTTSRKIANLEGGLGIVTLRLGYRLLAIQHFERASESEPSNADYHVSAANIHWLIAGATPKADTPIADVLRFEQHIEQATKEYEDVLTPGVVLKRRDISYLYRTLAQFYFLRASIRGRQPVVEYAAAVETYGTAIALAPTTQARNTYEKTCHDIASAMITKLEGLDWSVARGLYDGAIAAIVRARELGAKQSDDQLSRAYALHAWRVYALDGATDDAIRETLLAREVAASGSYQELRALYNLTVMHLAKGDVVNARTVYEKAAALAATKNPDFKPLIDLARTRLQALASDRPEVKVFIAEVLPQLTP